MHPDLHRYLDGEITADELPAELRADAEAWDALLAEAATLRAVRAPASLEARVMAALPETAAPSLWRKLAAWLLEPKPIRVRPIVALVGGVAALLLLIRPPADVPAPPVLAPVTAVRPAAAPATAVAPTVYVQFVFAGDARSVALAGDFNGWDPARHVLRDPDGDGVWTGLFALPPGLHKYMFVVDGERWETDPRAERYVDDGFGMRNAIINVVAPTGRAS
ncbi:MAG TPA: hypothetical protein VF158_00610 [Longimicrobiales bacterium]